MEFSHSGESLLKVKTDILVLGIFRGEKFSGSVKSVDDALGGVLKDLCGDEKFEGIWERASCFRARSERSERNGCC